MTDRTEPSEAEEKFTLRITKQDLARFLEKCGVRVVRSVHAFSDMRDEDELIITLYVRKAE